MMRTLLKTLIVMALMTLAGASTWHAQAADDKPQWSYHGETGPKHWGSLDPAFAVAKNGREQSPIDIKVDSAEVVELPPRKDKNPVHDPQSGAKGSTIAKQPDEERR